MNLTRDLTFLVLYVLGFTGILYWRRRQSDPALFFYCGSWTFMMMVTYFIVLEIFYSTFYFLIPLVFFSIFAFSYFTEKRKLLNGVLFNFFLISFGGYLVTLLLETQNIFIGGLFAIIAIPVLLILLFGVYILIVFLFWNGLLRFKKRISLISQSLNFIISNLFDVIYYISNLLYPIFPTMVQCIIHGCPIDSVLSFCGFL